MWIETGGTVSNDHISDIFILRASIKEFLNQPHKHLREKNESLLKIDELLQNAEYLGEHSPYKQDAKDKGVISEHIFSTPIAGEKSYLIVWEYRDGRKILHGVSDSENVLKTD